MLAALVAGGATPSLTWGQEHGSLVAAQFVAFLRAIPRVAAQPLVVVLDNGSIHVSRLVREARAALQRDGIYLYYLPPYSPQLNRIEPVFKQIKHHEMPKRSHTSKAQLRESVEQGFASYRKKLCRKGEGKLCPAA